MLKTKILHQISSKASTTSPLNSTSSLIHLPLRHLFHPKHLNNGLSFVDKQVLPLPSNTFDTPLRKDILHSCVLSYLFSNRDGTIAHVKNRHEVNGSHRKQRPQKGTGHSRMGTKQSPLLVGGGQAHGPRNTRNWQRKVNKKVWAFGMKVALSDKLRSGSLIAIPSSNLDLPRTNKLSRQLSNLNWLDRTLFITKDNILKLASRNIKTVKTLTPNEVDVYDVIRWKRVVIDVESLNNLYDKIQLKAGEVNANEIDSNDLEDLEGVEETEPLTEEEERILLDKADNVVNKL